MALFSKMRDMYKLQKQAKVTRHELKNIHIEAEADNMVTVTLSAEQEVIDIGIAEHGMTSPKKTLEEALKKALNKALKKAQGIASEKTKHLWKDMGVGK